MKKILFIIFLFSGIYLCIADMVHANILENVSTDTIQNVSINVGVTSDTDIARASRDFGFRVLTAFRMVISGFALIYLVLIGAYMIVYSDSEERIKSQKNQITYSLIGFLFLNIPGLVYTIFFGSDVAGRVSLNTQVIGDNAEVTFWSLDYLTGVNGFIPIIINFFEIFIFGLAIVLFTWGFFRLILSGGDEEVQKKAKTRITYGILGLIFLGFVRYWGVVIARGDFFGEFSTVSRKLIGLSLYFAAPVVVFFLVMGAYYYITSAGDEERTKKAKAIFTNTLIASLILLGAYSFLSDLAKFTL